MLHGRLLCTGIIYIFYEFLNYVPSFISRSDGWANGKKKSPPLIFVGVLYTKGNVIFLMDLHITENINLYTNTWTRSAYVNIILLQMSLALFYLKLILLKPLVG